MCVCPVYGKIGRKYGDRPITGYYRHVHVALKGKSEVADYDDLVHQFGSLVIAWAAYPESLRAAPYETTSSGVDVVPSRMGR